MEDVLDNLVDAIMDCIKDLLSNAISKALSTCTELLTMGLKPPSNGESGTVTGLLDQFLYSDPANFTGSSDANATKVWDIIQKICDNAVIPIAGAILAIFLIFDLISSVMSGNNFHEFDDSIFVKWILKCVCGIILISNITYITQGLLSFGTTTAIAANNILFGSEGYVTEISPPSVSSLNDTNIGVLIIEFLMSGLLIIIVMLVLGFIIVTLASRMIEIFMYVGISPIPLVTFMNTETKQTGQNWVRNVLALAFQGLFISIALGMFLVLFNNACQNISELMDMVVLLGYSVALLFTVLRSGSIAKSIFNAH